MVKSLICSAVFVTYIIWCGDVLYVYIARDQSAVATML